MQSVTKRGSVEKIQVISSPSPAAPPSRQAAPNRRRHEQQLEQVDHHLQRREDERRALLAQQHDVRDNFRELRSQRDAVGEHRAEVDERLTGINKEVDTLRDQLQRIRSGLTYQNEENLTEQIKKLEYNLHRHNYKPAEEKRLVQEIDRLNRSMKLVKEHSVLKAELDSLRDSQRDLREQRDELFREG